MRKLEQEDRDNTLLLEYQMKEERKERQRLATMAWTEARASNYLEKLTKALCDMELQYNEVPDYDQDEDGDSKMTKAEMAESEEEVESYLNRMFTNFECGDVAASMNGTTNYMEIDNKDDDAEDDAMEDETNEAEDDGN